MKAANGNNQVKRLRFNRHVFFIKKYIERVMGRPANDTVLGFLHKCRHVFGNGGIRECQQALIKIIGHILQRGVDGLSHMAPKKIFPFWVLQKPFASVEIELSVKNFWN